MGESDEDEEEMIAVEGSDGQQYVVLEVIQLADGDESSIVAADGQTELLTDGILADSGIILVFYLGLTRLTLTYCSFKQI